MKNLKTAVWIILLVIFQSALNILGITIPLIIPFAVSAAFAEDKFGYAFFVGMVCGILEGALFGSEFTVSVFITAVTVIGIFGLRSRSRTGRGIVKIPVLTFFSILLERTLSFLVKCGSLDMFVSSLPFAAVMAVVGAAASAVIYALLKKTVYKSNYKTFIL